MYERQVENFSNQANDKINLLEHRPAAIWIGDLLAGAYVGIGIILIILAGIVIPGARVAAHARHRLIYCDGLPYALVHENKLHFLTEGSDETRHRAYELAGARPFWSSYAKGEKK